MLTQCPSHPPSPLAIALHMQPELMCRRDVHKFIKEEELGWEMGGLAQRPGARRLVVRGQPPLGPTLGAEGPMGEGRERGLS